MRGHTRTEKREIFRNVSCYSNWITLFFAEIEQQERRSWHPPENYEKSGYHPVLETIKRKIPKRPNSSIFRGIFWRPSRRTRVSHPGQVKASSRGGRRQGREEWMQHLPWKTSPVCLECWPLPTPFNMACVPKASYLPASFTETCSFVDFPFSLLCA